MEDGILWRLYNCCADRAGLNPKWLDATDKVLCDEIGLDKMKFSDADKIESAKNGYAAAMEYYGFTLGFKFAVQILTEMGPM